MFTDISEVLAAAWVKNVTHAKIHTGEHFWHF
jgi:hypothetical protein